MYIRDGFCNTYILKYAVIYMYTYIYVYIYTTYM